MSIKVTIYSIIKRNTLLKAMEELGIPAKLVKIDKSNTENCKMQSKC
jgi:hypothetical protein